MPITQHDIDELKKIYRSQTGDELSDKEAWEITIRLVNLFRLLLEDKQKPNIQDDSDRPDNVFD